ncbi:MAG: imidazoleglycerol-phosphate dehydratase HisB [Clostridia bacterium]|nr:imidazoleglycerol-phosphate dehydratase HisB [Clostridia bacterium]
MRCSEIVRKTGETLVEIKLNIDGEGKSDIATGVGFLDHMLTLFAKHGLFDLTVKCKGDTEVDYHHTTEDVGIALGSAFEVALGAKRGINRYGDITLPMDDALVLSAVDLSGRAYYVGTFEIGKEKVGDFDTELVDEFFYAFSQNAKCNLHIRMLAGKNAHHIIEAMFKSVARSIRRAAEIDPRLGDAIPSTKGVL